MNNQKLRKVLRRALIVLLLVSAGVLLGETGYYSGIKSRLFPGGGEYTAPVSGAVAAVVRPTDAVQPQAAMVCGAAGERYGAAYDGETVSAVFSRFSAVVGEALGSSGTPEAVTEAQFRAALDCCGVFLRFYCPQPLELLSGWLGAEAGSTVASSSAGLMLLCAEGDAVNLYYRTEDAGYFRASTEVSPEVLSGRTAEYADNGARFAFEIPGLSDCEDFTVIPAGNRTSAVVKYSAPLYGSAETDELLAAMGMNSYLTSSYTEADGTQVYLYEDSILRVSPTGSVLFRRPADSESTAERTLSDGVNAAWQIAERCIGAGSGAGTLLFAGTSYDETQRSRTLLLDYAVGGIPVQLASGHAAELVMQGDTVIQARLQLCRFSSGDETAALLPDLQAHAVAGAERAGAVLRYLAGGETMNCTWVKTDG